MILGVVTFLLGLYGLYGIFSGVLFPLSIVGFAGFISNLYGLATGQLKTLYPTIVILFFGIRWSNSLGLPIWIDILAGLC